MCKLIHIFLDLKTHLILRSHNVDGVLGIVCEELAGQLVEKDIID